MHIPLCLFLFPPPHCHQGALFPLPDPPDQARQLRHRGERGEYGLRPAGGQTEQGHLRHRGGHGRSSSAAQIPVHFRRSAQTWLK